MPTASAADPMPLSAAQVATLVRAATRELSWGLHAVSTEIHAWRDRAAAIPEAPTREDALSSLARKRGHTDGAALFCILPRRRNPALLKLVVAFEIIWDFLDNVSERGAHMGDENGLQLHLAFVDALDPRRPIADYYRHHPWQDDGGYLRSLVETCRAGCAALPSYERVKATVVQEARRGQVQALNHGLDPAHRDATLERWAFSEFPGERRVSWFELTGATSASLVIHVLLALAAEPGCSDEDVAQTYAAYFPWPSLATTLLDSYVDQVDDAATGNHSYVAHYASDVAAFDRTRDVIERAAWAVRDLPNGHRHAVIVACMIAMYLSKDSARTPELRATTQELARAGGSLTRLLLPILRAWRIRYGQRAA